MLTFLSETVILFYNISILILIKKEKPIKELYYENQIPSNRHYFITLEGLRTIFAEWLQLFRSYLSS